MSKFPTRTSLFSVALLVTLGCGASAPPAAVHPASTAPTEPAATAATAPETGATPAPTAAPPAAPAASAPEPNPAAEPSASAKTEPEATPTPPSELLTAEGVVFVLDWQASTPQLVATEKCQDRVGEDAAAVAQCVEGERAKFSADVLRFRKVGGQLRWTVYKRTNDRLQMVYSVPFVFADETDYSVSLLLQGKGNGYPPIMSRSTTVPLNFPSAYSIELNDPVLGTLVYTSKRGLVAD